MLNWRAIRQCPISASILGWLMAIHKHGDDLGMVNGIGFTTKNSVLLLLSPNRFFTHLTQKYRVKIRNFTIAPSPSSSKPILESTGLNRTQWILASPGVAYWIRWWYLEMWVDPSTNLELRFQHISEFTNLTWPFWDSCLFKAKFLGSIYQRCGWWSNFMMVDWWQVRTPNFPPGLFNLGAQLSQVETSLFVTHPGPRKVKNLRSLPSAFHGQPGELPLRHVAIFR
jgi:hypothetical protein